MKLSRLFVYPVKSLAGVELAEAEVDDFGIMGDRRWLVVDEIGEFLTQRDVPQMALIKPRITAFGLRLDAPGMSALEVETPGDCERTVRIWADLVNAFDSGPAPAEWLSRFLARPVSLVYMPESTFRRVAPNYVPAERRVGFADAFPFLIVTQESMDGLNRRLTQPLGIERFRPNIVISGADRPHAEDEWKRIRVGEMEFDLPKPCARCTIPTVDPLSAERGKEPTRTLATYRKWDGNIWFAMNAVHASPGQLSVGAEARVLT